MRSAGSDIRGTTHRGPGRRDPTEQPGRDARPPPVTPPRAPISMPPRDEPTRAGLVTPNWQPATTSRVDVSVSPCGTDAAAGEYDCGGPSENDGRHVIVATADSFGGASGLQDEAFYLVALP